MDPHATTGLVALTVNSNIYESLVYLDAELRLRPQIASAWQSVDERTWSFDLSPGIRFQDGSPLDARDVVFSLLRARDDPASEWSPNLATIESVESPSPLRVEVRTLVPDALLATNLAPIFIVPRSAGPIAGSTLGVQPNGSGPYRLASAEGALDLETWEGYRKARPEVSRLVFMSIPGDRARVAALLDGRLDLIEAVPPDATDPIAGAPGLRLVERTGVRHVFLGFDHARERTPYASPIRNPFRDRRVRQAIGLAIDRQELVGEIDGAGNPAYQLVATGVFGWDPELGLHGPPDLSRARELLAQAGYAGGFGVVLDAGEGSLLGDARVAPFVARSLARIGVRVELRLSEKTELFRRWARHDTSFFLSSWTCSSGDMQEVLDYLLHTPEPGGRYGTENAGGYSNPDLDRLAEQGRASPDPAARLAALRQAARIALDDVAWVPLYLPTDRYALREGLDWSPRPDQLILGAEMRVDGAPQARRGGARE